MALDLSVIIGDGLLAGGAVTAAIAGRRQLKHTRAAAEQAVAISEENAGHLQQLRDTAMDDRIRTSVAEYVEQHPSIVGEAVMFDAMRDLLDAIIVSSLDLTPAERRARLHDDDRPHR